MKPSGPALGKLVLGPRSIFCAPRHATMKLAITFLVFCAVLLSNSGAAFFVDSVVKPVAEPVAALAPVVEAVAGAVPSPPLNYFSLLKFIFNSLGIPIGHLIEGSKKCVTELGPEAVEALKTLLGVLTPYG